MLFRSARTAWHIRQRDRRSTRQILRFAREAPSGMTEALEIQRGLGQCRVGGNGPGSGLKQEWYPVTPERRLLGGQNRPRSKRPASITFVHAATKSDLQDPDGQTRIRVGRHRKSQPCKRSGRPIGRPDAVVRRCRLLEDRKSTRLNSSHT